MLKLGRNEERIVLILVIVLLGIAVIYRFVVFKTESVSVIKKETREEEKEITKEPVKIYVNITGEVKTPGLYIHKEGDRVADLIKSAGGFTDNADTASINLAEKLKDEQSVNICAKGSSTEGMNTKANPISGGKININIATAKELDDFLPGIGETYANSIVNYRNKNGKFKSIDEITKVDGIGSGKRFENLKGLITIN